MATDQYYGTYFTRESLDKELKRLKDEGVETRVEREKPTFSSDKFKWKIYTDRYIWRETK
jgi:hypothetical protein